MSDRRKFNPANRIYDTLFGEGDDNPYASSMGKQRLLADDAPPTGGIDDLDQAREAESQGSEFGYQPGSTASSAVQGKAGALLRFGQMLKKGGPAGFIVGSLLTGGAFLTMFMGPAGMVSQMAEQLTEKFNYQDVSAHVRAKKILNMKKNPSNLYGLVIEEGKFFGFVSPNGRAVRFSTVSDKMIERMKANGIDVQTEETFFGKKRITEMTFHDPGFPDGKKVITSASELTDLASKNPIFFDKIAASNRGKFGLWFDKRAAKVKEYLKVDFNRLKTKITGEGESDTSKSVAKDLDESLERNIKEGVKTEGELRGAINQEGVDPDVAEKLNSSVDESELTKKTGYGSQEGVNKLLGAVDKVSDVCSVYNIVNKVEYLTKVFKGIQLARYASKFLATAAALKAGDATEEEVAYFANKLTATQPVTKNINGQQELVGYTPTAMDSQGMYYAMTGLMGTPNESFKQFQLGINDDNLLNAFFTAKAKINEFIKSKEWGFNITQFCHVMDAPLVAGAGVVLFVASCIGALATGGITLAGCFGMISLKSAFFEAVKAAGFELGKVWLADQIQKAFGGSFVTKKTQGEDAGNAIVSGSGYLMGQNAIASGNMPLTKTQALAYMKARDEYIAQRGEMIRATHSPFDITTRHTMMGSIVNKALPQMARMHSFVGRISSIMSMGLGSVKGLLPGVSAVSEAEKAQLRSKAFDVCKDGAYAAFADINKDGVRDVALDPNCNWVLGIPVRELNSPDYAPPNVINHLAPGTFKTDSRGVVTGVPNDYLMMPKLDEKGKITNIAQLKAQGQAVSNYATAVLQKGYFKPVDKDGNECSFEPIIYSEQSEGDKPGTEHLISAGVTGREIMYTPAQAKNPCYDETGFAYEFEWRLNDRNSSDYTNIILKTLRDPETKKITYSVKKYTFEPDGKVMIKDSKKGLSKYKSGGIFGKKDIDCGVNADMYFIQDDKYNPLLRFKYNCLSRGELPFGMTEMNDHGKPEDYIEKSWGRKAVDWLMGGKMPKVFDSGGECILSGESDGMVSKRDADRVALPEDDPTIKFDQSIDPKNYCNDSSDDDSSDDDSSDDDDAPSRASGPNKFENISARDRIMFALYYMDERIQCSLDEDENCDESAGVDIFGRPNPEEVAVDM